MGHTMRKPVLSYVIIKGTDQPTLPRTLISASIVRCLDRNESSNLYSSIGTYTVSPTCQFAESVLLLHVHLFKSKFKFNPAGTVLHRFCFPVYQCGYRFMDFL